ncbi:copal-8-ol diphosphate hydratase, chloroplastic-like [Sesamum indicum]|uniref:Copal-8-ol diphosphate hydratase, chloroplastic-like n=1 Tax=Sesamum indicum TaxID=4182 RepID=A0A6I9TH49_SESIN|nr:copal-8-ol diphosphate hydratase, chloroplastic-like [Sesamum indicum]
MAFVKSLHRGDQNRWDWSQKIRQNERRSMMVFRAGSWLISTNNTSISSNIYQILDYKQTTKVAESRVFASLDVAQACDEDDSTAEALQVVNKIEEYIGSIKMMLSTIDEGRISVSPYDTAWIALIKDVDGRGTPQFPSCLEWIAQHQLPDGSWGDERYFCAYDRLVNTLACVVALKSWNVHADQSQKGISYIKENVHKLENADGEHMTAGFELVFPALLQKSRNLGIHDLPYDAPVLRDIYSARDRKMKRIPKELMHKVLTPLLYSLEGLEDLEWQKLLKLQSPDGSFLTSPSSTAFAFMQTGDPNCLKFIKYTLQKCNGGAPHTFPVDIFARLWAVDRLQRLGISRFFESEIKDCLSHIYRYWSEKGVFSGRYSEFCDMDDTSMGFRLLRLHGFEVDPNVLSNFKNDDKFSCFGGQMIESASPIYNLYRASQVRFPGERILEEANTFAYKFLQDKLDTNQFLDKWIISKHLPDEIRIGLTMPWYASLPRIETRFYLQHYAGADDVWIGKTLYRMEEISNDGYLELARLDFNRCQAQHQTEWTSMQQWYENFNVNEFGVSRKDVLLAYFLGSASMFEADRSKERMAWAKSQIISKMITSFFNEETTSSEQMAALLTELGKDINAPQTRKCSNREQRLINILLASLHQLLEGFDTYTSQRLKNAWGEWIVKLQGEVNYGHDAELLTTTLNICAGYPVTYKDDILSHYEYKNLSNLTNKICQHLSQIQNKKVLETNGSWNTRGCSIKNMKIEQDMQTLLKLVVEESGGLDRNLKQTFLSVAKTYYYRAYTAPETIDMHTFKVLFDPVV